MEMAKTMLLSVLQTMTITLPVVPAALLFSLVALLEPKLPMPMPM